MRIEKTLGIIKPDALSSGHSDAIFAMLKAGGLTIEATQTLRISREQAETFYAIHRERPFFDELVTYITSNNITAFIASGTDAIKRYRELIGATDPKQAAPGTVRARFGQDKGRNAVHGSDSPLTAQTEIRFFFPEAS